MGLSSSWTPNRKRLVVGSLLFTYIYVYTIQYNTIQYTTIQYYTILYNTCIYKYNHIPMELEILSTSAINHWPGYFASRQDLVSICFEIRSDGLSRKKGNQTTTTTTTILTTILTTSNNHNHNHNQQQQPPTTTTTTTKTNNNTNTNNNNNRIPHSRSKEHGEHDLLFIYSQPREFCCDIHYFQPNPSHRNWNIYKQINIDVEQPGTHQL